MKIRKGFVSNSSSSSFICEVCDKSEGGFDISISDVYMCMCEEGHEFCTEHAVNVETEFNNKRYDDNGNMTFYGYWTEDNGYEIPKKYCPLCQFEKLSSNDMKKYLMKKLNFKSKEDVFNEIKENFKSLEEFQKYIQ